MLANYAVDQKDLGRAHTLGTVSKSRFAPDVRTRLDSQTEQCHGPVVFDARHHGTLRFVDYFHETPFGAVLPAQGHERPVVKAIAVPQKGVDTGGTMSAPGRMQGGLLECPPYARRGFQAGGRLGKHRSDERSGHEDGREDAIYSRWDRRERQGLESLSDVREAV